MTYLSSALKHHNKPITWLILIFVCLALLTPTSLWIKDSEISIMNTQQGDPLIIKYDGVIQRDFVGEYAVTITDLNLNQVICDASGGPFPYKAGHTRPDVITMEWWAVSDDRCYGKNVPSGAYSMTTCWVIHPIIFGYTLPITRRHCITTGDPFLIHPRG